MRLVIVLSLVLVAGCSKCGAPKATARAEAARYVPRDVEAALVVPDLGVLGDRISQLQEMKLASFAAQLEGFPDAKSFADALMRQAGIDLRSRDAMKKAGLAPERGLAVALLPNDVAYAVVGVSDAKVFAQTLAELAKNRLGAATLNKETVDGVEHIWFSRTGKRAELAYVLVDGFALVSSGKAGARLPERARLKPEVSLASDPRLVASLKRLPKQRDLYLHVPADTGAATQGGQQQRGARHFFMDPGLVGFTAVGNLARDALRIHVDAPWPDSPQTLAALEPKKGADLLSRLPSDAFALARFNGDPLALEPLWPLLVGPHLERALKDAKLDVKSEVLANLQPGLVASLSVSPQIPLGSGMPELDVRRTNPFRYAHLVAVAQAKEPARVAALLARLPEIAPRFGAQIEPVTKDGRTLYTTRYAQGEGIHFAEAGPAAAAEIGSAAGPGAGTGLIVLASPLARMEQSLAAPKHATAPRALSDAALREPLTRHALGMVVDLDQLRDSVKSLPPEAWGIGGFAIKASAVRWLDATDDLRAITVGVTRRDSAVQSEIALRFRQQ